MRWYVSIYDQDTQRLVREEPLKDVSDEEIRRHFQVSASAIGGFPVSDAQVPFVRVHSGIVVDLSKHLAFVEFLDDRSG